MTIGPETLRQAMRKWTSGVTVVSAQFEGQKHGMTVSSFFSVSLDPPMVLVSIANTARTGDLIRKSGVYGVTILSESQQEVSELFASRKNLPRDRFSQVDWTTLISELPYPAGGLVMMECRVVESFPAGTTMLFLGEVIALQEGEGNNPLVYFNRDYQELCT